MGGIWNFLDNLISQKWGDLCGLFFVILGVWLVTHNQTPLIERTAEGLITSGMVILRPKTIDRSNSNGNGNGKTNGSGASSETKTS